MDLSSGVGRRLSGNKQTSNKPSRLTNNKRGGSRSRGSRSQSKKAIPVSMRKRSRKSQKISRKSSRLPKTALVRSRKSAGRVKMSRASSAMSITELQFMAKSRGVPFGGLSRNKLIKKINNYMY